MPPGETPETNHRMVDGGHPAGSVMDPQRGVQHIFVYMGAPIGPAGNFYIRRTLDTPRLSAMLDK